MKRVMTSISYSVAWCFLASVCIASLEALGYFSTRGADIAMRLDYAGVRGDVIELVEGVDAALRRAITRSDRELLVVANYTAMLEVRELVAEQGFAARYWS